MNSEALMRLLQRQQNWQRWTNGRPEYPAPPSWADQILGSMSKGNYLDEQLRANLRRILRALHASQEHEQPRNAASTRPVHQHEVKREAEHKRFPIKNNKENIMRTEGDFIKITEWLLPLSWLYGVGVRIQKLDVRRRFI